MEQEFLPDSRLQIVVDPDRIHKIRAGERVRKTSGRIYGNEEGFVWHEGVDATLDLLRVPAEEIERVKSGGPETPNDMNQDGPTWRDDSRLTKGERQRRAILATVAVKQWDAMRIPDGGKGTLKELCALEYPDLFDGDTSFDNAWKAGLKNYWQMANHASYSRRGLG